MKALLISMLLMLGTLMVPAQTTPTLPGAMPSPTPPSAGRTVVVSQQFLDDATRAFAELVATRDALNKALAERGASGEVIKALNDSLIIRDKIVTSYEQLMQIQKQIIDLQQTVIEKTLSQLNKPRSAWQKFLAAVEKVLYLAAGVALGRGIP